MTQEQKNLLFKDLCARLPYGIKGNYQNSDDKLLRSITIVYGNLKPNGMVMTGDIKPYLFPLSSMTEEQRKYIADRWDINEDFDFEIDPNWGEYFVDLCDAVDYINWLNENHFDYRGLIEKSLALDATGLNIY